MTEWGITMAFFLRKLGLFDALGYCREGDGYHAWCLQIVMFTCRTMHSDLD